jgi:hypothetical protein
MKIEKTNYVIMRIGSIDIGRETVYLVYDSEKGYTFTNDILMANKYTSRIAAKYEKFEFEKREHNGYDVDLQIIPVKHTYEW